MEKTEEEIISSYVKKFSSLLNEKSSTEEFGEQKRQLEQEKMDKENISAILEEMRSELNPKSKATLFEHNDIVFDTKEELEEHLLQLRIEGKEKDLLNTKVTTMGEMFERMQIDRIYGKRNWYSVNRYEYIGDFRGFSNVVRVALAIGYFGYPKYYALDNENNCVLYWDYNEWERLEESQSFNLTNPKLIDILNIFKEKGIEIDTKKRNEPVESTNNYNQNLLRLRNIILKKQ